MEVQMERLAKTRKSSQRLNSVRDAIRVRQYSDRTEQTYLAWIRRFILFHGKRHPQSMGPEDIRKFLSHLAVQREVTASTQNQTLSALVFLYRHVLRTELDWGDGFEHAKRPLAGLSF